MRESLNDLLAEKLFKALSDPTRLAILVELAESGSEQRVSEVAQCCPVNLSVVSRHLKTLKDAGILESKKLGKEVFYRVRVGELVAQLRRLALALEECCPDGVCGPGACRPDPQGD